MATLRDLNRIHEMGFDNSSLVARVNRTRQGPLHVACSQCDALVINGTATHERGCPNAVRECNGCNELIPQRQRYCEDCR